MLWRADRLVVASDEGAKFGGLERRISRISRAPAAGPHPHLLLSSNTTTLRSRWAHMTRHTSESIIRTPKTIAIHEPPIQADFCYVLSLDMGGSVIRVQLSTPGCHVGEQATPDARSLAHRGVGVGVKSVIRRALFLGAGRPPQVCCDNPSRQKRGAAVTLHEYLRLLFARLQTQSICTTIRRSIHLD